MARDVQHIEGHCALCRSRCGARFVVEDGRLTAVEPLPGHPTGGALCAKGRAAPQLQYHPARLTRPLRRTRPRGDADPGWEPVSWDEAMADIAHQLLAIRDQSGAQAVAFASASPGATALSDSLEWIERLIFSFGSPNFLTGVEICNWQRDHNHAYTFGTGIGMPDYAHTDLVILWGFNPGNVWLAQAQALAAARARGARVLVIDPVSTRHAQHADLWLPVRPGTDAALALGLARELMRLGGHDEAFVRRWTNAPLLIRDDTGQPLCERDIEPQAAGMRPMAWDVPRGAPVALDTTQDWGEDSPSAWALRGRFVVQGAHGPLPCRPAMAHYEAACEAWTPEQVEAFTGVPAARVREAAALIAAAHAPCYFSWTGIAQHANATQTDRAIAILFALTGAVDAPGGNLHLSRLPANPVSDRRLLDPAQAALALGLQERPLGPPAHGWTLGADFHRAVVEGQPYRVRALVGFGANLLMSQPDSHAMQQALAALEFQVHVDLFDTPTARHADYLLPACTPWEREGLRIGFEITAQAQHTVQLRPAVVAPAPHSQARADIAIVFELAQRLGLGEHFFGGDVEAGWNHQLAPLGLSTPQLRALPGGRITLPAVQATRQYAGRRADGSVRGFDTPSRRIELYSPRFQAAGLPPVPEVRAPRERFAPRAAWPLTLCCTKSGYYCQSQHRGVAALRAKEPKPLARLHPALAQARGLAEGDVFEVQTAQGAARFRLRSDATLAADIVMLSFGWWQACADLGLPAIDPLAPGHSNMNALVDASVADAASGAVPLRAWPCEVRALAGARGWNGWKALAMRCVSRPAQGVLELSLAAVDGTRLPDHRAGQYVRLALGPPGGGVQERCYSLIHAADGRDGAGHAVWRIAVGRGREGGVSEALHRWFDAHPHDALTVRAQRPAGRFLLPLVPERPTVLLAAGIGITPFLGMLETMAARVQNGAPSPTQPLRLLYGNRNRPRHAFGERLAALARWLPTLEVTDFYSQGDEPDGPRTRAGRVGARHIDTQWLQDDARFYACGPPAMLRELRDSLLARGMPRHAFFAETFSTPTPGRAAPGPVEVHFVRSGIRATWTEADRHLLGLAERVGAPLTGGCRVGQCESCRVGVRSGQIHHLGPTDAADEGDCLACIAVPTSPLEIDA